MLQNLCALHCDSTSTYRLHRQLKKYIYIYIFKQALSFLDGRETGFVQVYLERGVELLKILAY